MGLKRIEGTLRETRKKERQDIEGFGREMDRMNLKIREAEARDGQDIARLNQEDLGYEYSIQGTREKLEQVLSSGKDKVFVAVMEEDGEERLSGRTLEKAAFVVGYIHACDYDVLYCPHLKNIMGIAVSSEYRGRGIGRALLEQVELWAKESGAIGVRLVSGAGRTGAHEFYRRCGYTGGKEQINFKKIF